MSTRASQKSDWPKSVTNTVNRLRTLIADLGNRFAGRDRAVDELKESGAVIAAHHPRANRRGQNVPNALPQVRQIA